MNKEMAILKKSSRAARIPARNEEDKKAREEMVLKIMNMFEAAGYTLRSSLFDTRSYK
ncbi:hypothetical protein P7H25_09240 [Paenibacillus larvae]|nr:hypothetical protein [Paenibacillus larvae]MDT2255787.1 hypothetical protein [Paenibacillus larvae]